MNLTQEIKNMKCMEWVIIMPTVISVTGIITVPWYSISEKKQFDKMLCALQKSLQLVTCSITL
jgi:hypothetical protein